MCLLSFVDLNKGGSIPSRCFPEGCHRIITGRGLPENISIFELNQSGSNIVGAFRFPQHRSMRRWLPCSINPFDLFAAMTIEECGSACQTRNSRVACHDYSRLGIISVNYSLVEVAVACICPSSDKEGCLWGNQTTRGRGTFYSIRSDFHVQLMATHKKVLGQEHPDTLTTMNNLASTYRDWELW